MSEIQLLGQKTADNKFLCYFFLPPFFTTCVAHGRLVRVPFSPTPSFQSILNGLLGAKVEVGTENPPDIASARSCRPTRLKRMTARKEEEKTLIHPSSSSTAIYELLLVGPRSGRIISWTRSFRQTEDSSSFSELLSSSILLLIRQHINTERSTYLFPGLVVESTNHLFLSFSLSLHGWRYNNSILDDE